MEVHTELNTVVLLFLLLLLLPPRRAPQHVTAAAAAEPQSALQYPRRNNYWSPRRVPPTQQDWDAFFDDLAANGVFVDEIAVADLGAGRGHGIVRRDNENHALVPGWVVAGTPMSLMLNGENHTGVLGAIRDSNTCIDTPEVPPKLKTILALLYETLQGDDSRWSRYIAILPSSPAGSCVCDPEHALYRICHGGCSHFGSFGYIYNRRVAEYEALLATARGLRAGIDGEGLLLEPSAFDRAFCWAFGQVQSRSYNLEHPTDPHLLAGATLIPLIDMFNHETGSEPSSWLLKGKGDAFPDTFGMVAPAGGLPPGGEAVVSYDAGDAVLRCNADLLVKYGFTEGLPARECALVSAVPAFGAVGSTAFDFELRRDGDGADDVAIPEDLLALARLSLLDDAAGGGSSADSEQAAFRYLFELLSALLEQLEAASGEGNDDGGEAHSDLERIARGERSVLWSAIRGLRARLPAAPALAGEEETEGMEL